MCTKWTGKWYRTKKDITAYKVVLKISKHDYISHWPPRVRSPQRRPGSYETYKAEKGSSMHYYLGKEAKAGFPGMYCYQRLSEAQWARSLATILKVRIPKGTLVCHGVSFGRITINTKKLIPIKEVL